MFHTIPFTAHALPDTYKSDDFGCWNHFRHEGDTDHDFDPACTTERTIKPVPWIRNAKNVDGVSETEWIVALLNPVIVVSNIPLFEA